MAAVQFLFDEHLPNAFVRAVRNLGIDVLTSQQTGLLQQPDDHYIRLGLETGRVIVTLDEDYLIGHYSGKHHAGIVYAKPNTVTFGAFLRFLELVHDIYSSDQMIGRLERM